jgi:hypothetical protein
MKPAHSEFETLIAAILDGDAGLETRERMAALLRADPALRAEYVQQMRVDSLLGFATGRVASSAATTIAAPTAGKIVRFPFYRMAAAAAVSLLAGALFWSSRPTPRAGDAPDHSPRLAQELPSLIDAPPKSLVADIPLPDSETASTDFLLPAYLDIHIP